MQVTNPQNNLARPPHESWRTGKDADRRVDFQTDPLLTTGELVRNIGEIGESGLPATYFYQRDCSLMKPATTDKYRFGIRQGAMLGSLAGLGTGLAMIGIAGLFGKPFYGICDLGVVIPTALATVAGAVVGAVTVPSEHSHYRHYGESLGGKLKLASGPDGQKHLFFEPNYNPSDKVDLEKFVQAPTTPGGEPLTGVLDGSNANYWWQHGMRVGVQTITEQP